MGALLWLALMANPLLAGAPKLVEVEAIQTPLDRPLSAALPDNAAAAPIATELPAPAVAPDAGAGPGAQESPRAEAANGVSEEPVDPGAAMFDGVPAEVRDAALDVLRDYKSQGRALPWMFGGRPQDAEQAPLSRSWFSRFDRPDLPRYRSTERISMSDRSSLVIRVRSNGFVGQKYFRPIDQLRPEVPRRTFAASLLSAALRLAVSPRAQLAYVDGKPGVLSEPAAGLTGALPQILRGRWSNPRYADAMAFVFLLGDSDASTFNSKTGLLSGARTFFDAGEAFQPRLVLTREASRLPNKYTPSFLKSLRAFDPAALQGLLTGPELDALLFRRDLLLKDAARRGDAALLPR